jgi:hypothetical protein
VLLELRQLIQKKHAVVRQADLAGSGDVAYHIQDSQNNSSINIQ